MASGVAPDDNKVAAELINVPDKAVSVYDNTMINFGPSNQLDQQMS
jgi:hypothetical protein